MRRENNRNALECQISQLPNSSWVGILLPQIALFWFFFIRVRASRNCHSQIFSLQKQQVRLLCGFVVPARFNRADECAHELAVHLCGNRLRIDALG